MWIHDTDCHAMQMPWLNLYAFVYKQLQVGQIEGYLTIPDSWLLRPPGWASTICNMTDEYYFSGVLFTCLQCLHIDWYTEAICSHLQRLPCLSVPCLSLTLLLQHYNSYSLKMVSLTNCSETVIVASVAKNLHRGILDYSSPVRPSVRLWYECSQDHGHQSMILSTASWKGLSCLGWRWEKGMKWCWVGMEKVEGAGRGASIGDPWIQIGGSQHAIREGLQWKRWGAKEEPFHFYRMVPLSKRRTFSPKGSLRSHFRDFGSTFFWCFIEVY